MAVFHERLHPAGYFADVEYFKNAGPKKHLPPFRCVGLEDLKHIGTVITVAGGDSKSEAVLGALRGGYLDTLLMDELTARGILSFGR